MAENEELTLTIRGLPQHNEAVDGEVFAAELKRFMRGLAASDVATNGKRRLKYFIADLKKNTATASIREQVMDAPALTRSGLTYYGDCLEAIYNDAPAARQFDHEVVKSIVDLNIGVGKKFDGGQVARRSSGMVILIDEFLEKRARRVLEDIERAAAGTVPFYKGRAFGAFDGKLLELNALTAEEKAVLVLTAGGKRIECVTIGVDPEKLRRAWKRRCIVSGTAHYSGEGGLPERIDATDVDVVEPGEGLGRWRGAFSGLSPDDTNWE